MIENTTYQGRGHPIHVLLQLRMHVIEALSPLIQRMFLKFPDPVSSCRHTRDDRTHYLPVSDQKADRRQRHVPAKESTLSVTTERRICSHVPANEGNYR